jgi:hypothetical protein
VLVFACWAQAQATTSAQLGILGGTQTNARCPLTLQLSGIVTGSPNLPFEYWFLNTRNGFRETSGVVTAMMPATGVAQITGSITIGVSTDPAKVNHVQVLASGQGQPTPTLSNEAAFSVTCGTGFPSRQTSATSIGPMGRTGIVALPGGLAIVPSAPTGLTSTLDPKVCGDHAGFAGFICLATIPAGHLTLVWDWAPSTAYQDLDGYRIYRVDGGRRTVVGTQNSADIKIQAFEQPASGFAGQCFAVSAHKNGAESALSVPFCPSGGSTTQKIVLYATQQRSVAIYAGDTTGLAGLASSRSSGPRPSDSLKVGYLSTANKVVLGDSFGNLAYRTGLQFNTESLMGRSIYRALLKLHVWTSQVGASNDTFWSCATAIGIAADSWWGSQSWINGEFGEVNPGRVHGPDVALDVTKIVADWASGRATNFGLVLKGDSEDMGAFRSDACLSTFSNPSLEVVYY